MRVVIKSKYVTDWSTVFLYYNHHQPANTQTTNAMNNGMAKKKIEKVKIIMCHVKHLFLFTSRCSDISNNINKGR